MKKIAILGGGIGALATAAELTNDPNWQKDCLRRFRSRLSPKVSLRKIT